MSTFVGPLPPLEQVTKPLLSTAECLYYTTQCKRTRVFRLNPIEVDGEIFWITDVVKKICCVADSAEERGVMRADGVFVKDAA